MSATKVMRYGPSQLGPNFPHAGFFAVPKTFLMVTASHWHYILA